MAHLETTVVHPDYRGNSLQSLTLQQAIPMVQDLGYKPPAMHSIPQNIYSLYNIMKNGLRVKAEEKIRQSEDGSDGLWRFILHRNLKPRP